MKKTALFFSFLLASVIFLTACASLATFQTQGGASYAVTSVATTDQALGATPASGNTLLVLTLATDANFSG